MPRDQHDPALDGAALLSAGGASPAEARGRASTAELAPPAQSAANPLDRYRRLQQRLRRRFAPFTREVCPGCPTPCCRRPAAVTPLDVTLAEDLGYRLPAGVEAAGDAVAAHLGLIPIPTLSTAGEPCSFLGSGGCTFPADLMPVGCVAFLCPFMEEWYSSRQLEELRYLIDELRAAYVELRAALLAGD